MKRSARIAVASLLAICFGGKAQAEAQRLTLNDPTQGSHHVAYPIVGIEGRNGDYFSYEPGVVVPLGIVPGSEWPIAALARAEVGVGGAGGGIGIALDVFPCDASRYPNPKEMLYGGLMMMEARAEQMYGPAKWTHTTFVGPQLTFNLMVFKLSAGWMIDVHDSREQHVQLGFGGGF